MGTSENMGFRGSIEKFSKIFESIPTKYPLPRQYMRGVVQTDYKPMITTAGLTALSQ